MKHVTHMKSAYRKPLKGNTQVFTSFDANHANRWNVRLSKWVIMMTMDVSGYRTNTDGTLECGLYTRLSSLLTQVTLYHNFTDVHNIDANYTLTRRPSLQRWRRARTRLSCRPFTPKVFFGLRAQQHCGRMGIVRHR